LGNEEDVVFENKENNILKNEEKSVVKCSRKRHSFISVHINMNP